MFDKERFSNTKTSKLTEKCFATRWGVNRSHLGVTLLTFETEEIDTIYTTPSSPSPIPLQIHRVVQSLGRRIEIRAEFSILTKPEVYMLALRQIIDKYGRIIHINFYYTNDDASGLMPSFDWTLELKEESPADVKIPRVARLSGVNILFHWREPQCYYHGGEEAHTKQQAPPTPPWIQLAHVRPDSNHGMCVSLT
ncbi:hypothetical protein BGZ98_009838 [Dissophora globulifera]|nr:hypothetical protein BGZ98_009838 [Dissophora globulifera]